MSLRIALVGYGKMGKAVEEEATKRGHRIAAVVDLRLPGTLEDLATQHCDCAIEFTQPEAALENYRMLLKAGVPIVTGTTGWLNALAVLRTEVEASSGSFMYSSNFSPGVNILAKLNAVLAKMMDRHPEFDCYIEEAHHRNKKDAPSGTAMSLAEQIIEALERKKRISTEALRSRPPLEEELSVSFTRAGEITGKHTVTYISDVESITIGHEAFNRRGFALGAVLGAEWLVKNKGFYNFADIFE